MADFQLTQSGTTVQELLDKVGTYPLNEGWTTLTTAFNVLQVRVGNSVLTTTAQDATSAINELDAEIGTLSNLTTTEKGSLVGAINEVNNATPNIPTIQVGSESVTVGTSTYKDTLITFDTPFASTPFVMATFLAPTGSTNSAWGQVDVAVLDESITLNGFTARAFNNTSASRTFSILWLAIQI